MAENAGRSLSFDSIAGDYDRTRVIPPVQREDIARICARESHLEKGGLFLDAGVGTGRFAEPLARLHPGQIIGADIARAMMAQAAEKVPRRALSLVNADLQRLPFRTGAFQGVLAVHILHLIEGWRQALAELRRVLTPRIGVLLLGFEQGGRSPLVDYYFQRARGQGVLAPSLGIPCLSQALVYLRRRDQAGGGGAQISLLSAPYLVWKREARIADTLDALRCRAYSQMRRVPEAAHAALLEETTQYARRAYGDLQKREMLESRFVLHTVRWPA